MLSDYIPFYFTPKSPMLLNIKTGYSGITKRPNGDIAILVSSCQHMAAQGVTMLFTDRHAYTMTAAWTADADDLAALIDWDILRRHDFARNDAYPDKMERYQAEALAHRHVPPAHCSGSVAPPMLFAPGLSGLFTRRGQRCRFSPGQGGTSDDPIYPG